MSISSVQGTYWHIQNLSAANEYGQFDVFGYVNRSGTWMTFDGIKVGWGVYDNLTIGGKENAILIGTYEYDSNAVVDVIIIGGQDYKNGALIQWLQSNASLLGGGTVSISGSLIYGNAITNATGYSLFEKIGFVYRLISTSKTLSFDLSTLDLTRGKHTFVVKATAFGFEDSGYSNEVTYTKS